MMYSTACIIIHGLAGSIEEILPLEKYLVERGIHVRSVKLYGHGETKSELARSNYSQWIKSAEDELMQLKEKFSRVIIVGFSMGGLIAVNLVNTYNVEGVVFINTPVYYWDIKRILLNLLTDFKAYSKQYFREGTDKPLGTLIEFVKLLNKAKLMFRRVSMKSLILQAQDDDTVHNKSADYIANHVAGEKIVKFYGKGGHQILKSQSKDKVCKDVFDFITNTYMITQ